MDVLGLNLNGFDVGLFFTNLATIIKVFHSDSKTKNVGEQTKAIQDDRVASKKSYDEKFAEYDVRFQNMQNRLDKGDLRFGNVEKKIDENFRDMKNEQAKIGGNVKFIMGLLKGIEQEAQRKRAK
jgi:hypothetical protein